MNKDLIQKIINQKQFNEFDPLIVRAKQYCAKQCALYNNQVNTEGNYDIDLLNQLFNKIGQDPYIEPDFWCSLGFNISLGDEVFFNHDVIIRDFAPVTFGSQINIAPRVIFDTVKHTASIPRLAEAEPIHIEDGVWIGANSTITAGVTIGKNSIIGAGSVVNTDVPPKSLFAGNPARFIKELH